MRERRRYNWKTTQRNLINLVRAYKICDMTRDKTLTEQTWDKISEVLGMSAFRCRRMWFSISTIYKRLKLMIIDGELTEMEVRMNYKVAKYLNGMLDFVDPWFTSAHTKQIIKVKNHLATKRTLSILLGYDIDNGSNICSGEIKLSEDPFGRNDEEGNVNTIVISNVTSAVKETDKTKISAPVKLKEDHLKNTFGSNCVDLATFVVKHEFDKLNKYPLSVYMDDLGSAICHLLQPNERRLLIQDIDAIVSDVLQG